jgi:hypothetical protein
MPEPVSAGRRSRVVGEEPSGLAAAVLGSEAEWSVHPDP